MASLFFGSGESNWHLWARSSLKCFTQLIIFAQELIGDVWNSLDGTWIELWALGKGAACT